MRPSFFVSKLGNKVYLTHGPRLWYNGVGIIIYKKLYDSYAWQLKHLDVPHMIAKASLLFQDLLLDGAYRAHFYENLPYGARWWLPPRTANMCSVICTLLQLNKSRLFLVSNLLLASSRLPIIFTIRDCRAIVNYFSYKNMNTFVYFPGLLLSKLNKIAALAGKMNNQFKDYL